MTAARCPKCDQPKGDQARADNPPIEGQCREVDWRARALAAEEKAHRMDALATETINAMDARIAAAESERDALRLSTLTAADDARRVCEEREQAALRMWRTATAQLDAVRAIVERLAEHDEAMTRGPWVDSPSPHSYGGGVVVFDVRAGDQTVAACAAEAEDHCKDECNARGIAALRNALPELIAAVGVRS